MLVLALLAAIAILVAVLSVVGWLLGWSFERVTRPLGATAEASERTVDLAHEFWDWLRLGR